ncbi:MAG: long-chain acyl-CoA synthetase, partial [Candidatus Azotimanducaceae bacterium]
KTLYQREVTKYNQGFSHYEHVKRFELLPYTWSIEGGEMTPTLKLKRKQIMAKYEMQINRIYNID